MKYIIYNKVTGEIKKRYIILDETMDNETFYSSIQNQLETDQDYIDDIDVNIAEYYIKNNELIYRGPKPKGFYKWNWQMETWEYDQQSYEQSLLPSE